MNNTGAKILDAVSRSLDECGAPPTLRELAREAGLASTCTVRWHLRKLADEGLIRIQPGRSRGITLLRKPQGIPIIGITSAGNGTEAIEETSGYADFGGMFERTDEMFALKVSGDSMTGAGICDGDLVFVLRQPDPPAGEIIVAILDGEAVVKRLSVKGRAVKLISENSAYRPIEIGRGREIRILGKVVGVFRKYGSH